MADESTPTSNHETRLAIIVVAVFIAIILTFATVGYLLVRSLENIQLLPDADPLPHTRLPVTESYANFSTEDLSPIEADLLGNATGIQVLVVRGVDGRVTSFASNDLFRDNVTRRTVCQLADANMTGDRVNLGCLGNGTVALSCREMGEVRSWTLDGLFGDWTAMADQGTIEDPSVPGLEPGEMPFPRHVEGWEEAWDSCRMGRYQVVVGAYWFQAGCIPGYYYPAVLFREAEGAWSTIIALDHHGPSGFTQVAGTALDDMVVVVNAGHHSVWSVYAVTDGTVKTAGKRPPSAGLD